MGRNDDWLCLSRDCAFLECETTGDINRYVVGRDEGVDDTSVHLYLMRRIAGVIVVHVCGRGLGIGGVDDGPDVPVDVSARFQGIARVADEVALPLMSIRKAFIVREWRWVRLAEIIPEDAVIPNAVFVGRVPQVRARSWRANLGAGMFGKLVLFPIRVDEAVMEATQAWAADIRRTRHIGEFGHWREHDSYKKALERLLRDLKSVASG